MFTATDLASEAFHHIPVNASIEAAIRKIIETNSRYLVAVNEAGVQGVLTAHNLLSAAFTDNIDVRSTSIEKIVSPQFSLIQDSDSIQSVVKTIANSDQDFFPVINKNREIVGVISLKEAVTYLGHNLELHEVYE